jgi:hypothetical protein
MLATWASIDSDPITPAALADMATQMMITAEMLWNDAAGRVRNAVTESCYSGNRKLRLSFTVHSPATWSSFSSVL